jgi:hypothetical protein
VSLFGGYVPHGTQSFEIMDSPFTIGGLFHTIQLPTLDGALNWDTSQLYAEGILSVTGPGIDGDFDADGAVDAVDYVVWRKGVGPIYTKEDYDDWRANFGATFGGGSSQFAALPLSSAIPEPTSALLFLIFAAIGVWRHRRGFQRPQFTAA